jgi:hypothetical protein
MKRPTVYGRFKMSIRKNLLALVAIVMGAATVPAVGQIVSLESGIEASADGMLMPSSAIGSILLTCDTCGQRSFRLTSETIYLIGQEKVSFADFSAHVRGTSYNVTIFIKTDEPVVRRIRAATSGAARLRQ